MSELLRAIGGGMWITVEISARAAIGSLLLGVVVTALRGGPVPALRRLAAAYVVAFRSIPLAVVCLLSAFGLPALGWSDLSYATLFGLALAGCTGAFVSDAIRAGIDAVPPGHTEQAHALGATAGQRALLVITPQAWRPTVVSVGRVLVAMVRNSALAGSFGVVGDLSHTLDRLAYAHAGSVSAVLLGVSIAYLVLTVPLTTALDRLERGPGGAATGTDDGVTRTTRRTPAAPGRHVRRGVNVTVTVALIGCAYLVVCRPMVRAGQFAGVLWAPMLSPADPAFVLFWSRIGAGLRATLTAGALAVTASLLCGTALVILQVVLDERRHRRSGSRAVALGARALATAVRLGMTVLRGLPVVITILVVSRGLPAWGLPLADPLWYLVIGLALHHLVAVAETIRTGLRELPASHRDAAYLMGAGPLWTLRAVLLPQALRAMLPALTGRLIVVLMDTSLAFLVGYEELLAVARQANGDLRAPVQVHLVVALIYLALHVVLAGLLPRPDPRPEPSRTR